MWALSLISILENFGTYKKIEIRFLCLKFIMLCRLRCGFLKQRNVMVGFNAAQRHSTALWCRVFKLTLVTTQSSSSQFEPHPLLPHIRLLETAFLLGKCNAFWWSNTLRTKVLVWQCWVWCREVWVVWGWMSGWWLGRVAAVVSSPWWRSWGLRLLEERQELHSGNSEKGQVTSTARKATVSPCRH